MRTYVAPMGYDTRRVSRPVVSQGVAPGDRIRLVRPADESDADRAESAIRDVRELLNEIEPGVNVTVRRVPVDRLPETLLVCCDLIDSADGEVVVSLSGGARDLLLPLSMAAIVYWEDVDEVLFFSDIDGSVRSWPLPNLGAQVPPRTHETFNAVAEAEGGASFGEIAERTDQAKSTVARHVADLEAEGVLQTENVGKAKRASLSLAGAAIAHRGL